MSHFETEIQKRNRMVAIDWIRFFSMIAIVHFHFHEATFYSNLHDYSTHSYIEWPLELYSRFMAFSGFSIVFISYFLIGLIGINPKKLKKLLAVASVGAVTLFLVYFDEGSTELEWDIYPYIAACSLLVFILSQWPPVLYAFAFLGVVAMALPPDFWQFQSLKGGYFYNALFGDYQALGKGSWPLVPWAGLPIFSYALGRWLRHSSKVLNSLKTMGSKERVLWLVLIIASSFHWGAFLPVPIGPGFYKFVQNLGRIEILSHMIMVLFFVRLGFLERFNQWATQQKALRWISTLQLNQRFFLFYIINWLWIGVFSQFEELYYQSPLFFDLVLLSLIPVTEVSCRSLRKLSTQIYPLFRARLHSAS